MTDRVDVLPSQVILNTDILSSNRYSYIGVGRLTDAILGETTQLNNLACTQNSPTPNLSVNIGQGEIYILEAVDTNVYPSNPGGLPTDSSLMMKQGIFLGANFPLTAPPSVGTSVNYLLQVAFQETDTNIVNRAYYNPANISAPIFQSVPTTRNDAAIITVKSGTPAPTGTQVTPTPDAGNVGAWVVTVANGQTQIINANITQYPSAPFITDKLKDKLSRAIADRLYAKRIDYLDTGIANSYILSLPSLVPPAVSAFSLQEITFYAANTNGGASTVKIDGGTTYPIVLGTGEALPAGSIVSGEYTKLVYNATLSSYVLLLDNAIAQARYAIITLGGNQTIPGATVTKIIFNTVEVDNFGIFNTGTNRIAPTVTGKYKIRVDVSVVGTPSGDGANESVALFKNGSLYQILNYFPPSGPTTVNEGANKSGETIISLIAGTDYVEAYAFSAAPSSGATVFANSTWDGSPTSFSRLQVDYLGT